mmetsp:Transcript_32043/g.37355  ORF Transcript_32043/g.37355 Transcript_32043/m.37355 type:complete len:300 (-) Transcript_32043:3-902(-)
MLQHQYYVFHLFLILHAFTIKQTLTFQPCLVINHLKNTYSSRAIVGNPLKNNSNNILRTDNDKHIFSNQIITTDHSNNLHKHNSKKNSNNDENIANRKNNKQENSRGDDVSNAILEPLEYIVNLLSIPIPTNSKYSLPLVYPLTLIGLNLMLEMPTLLLLDIFFLLFYTLGRSITIYDEGDEDEDQELGGQDEFIRFNNLLDLVVLFGSIASAGLISPTGLSFHMNGIMGNTGLSLVVVSALSGLLKIFKNNDGTTSFKVDNDAISNGIEKDETETSENPAAKLLDIWDRKFAELDKED